MNLKPILNNTSPQAHTESKLDVLPKKLVKYVVHLFLKINKKKFIIFYTKTYFWSQGILGIKTPLDSSHTWIELI